MKARTFLNNNIIMFISLMLFIKPLCINEIPNLNLFFNICLSIESIIILFIFFRRGKFSKLQFFLCLYIMSLIFSTFINKRDIFYCLKINIPILCWVMYIEMLIDSGNFFNFLKNFNRYYASIIFINFISILIKTINSNDEIERIFFLGYDNDFAPLLVIGAYIFTFSEFYRNNKMTLKSKILIIITIISAFLVYSATIKVGIILYIISMICIKLIKNKIKISYSFVIKLIWIIFILIVIFNIQKIFSNIIENFLHRNITFTGRTYIWEATLEKIKDNFILGTGVIDNVLRREQQLIYHAHSNFLQILLEGGIIAFVFFNILIILPNNSIKKLKKMTMQYNILTFLSIMGIFTYLFMTIVEVYVENNCFYALLTICIYLPQILTRKEEKDNENFNNNTGNFTCTKY